MIPNAPKIFRFQYISLYRCHILGKVSILFAVTAFIELFSIVPEKSALPRSIYPRVINTLTREEEITAQLRT